MVLVDRRVEVALAREELDGGLDLRHVVERRQADVAADLAARRDLVEAVARALELRRLHRGRRGEVVLGLFRVRRVRRVEALLQRRDGLHAELERVDALVRQAAVEELADRLLAEGGDFTPENPLESLVWRSDPVMRLKEKLDYLFCVKIFS